MQCTNFVYFTTHDRYSYQGQEMDNEVKGEGNSYDFGARMYDSRLGKFLSIDGFTNKFPHYSPYIFAGNTPILCIDINGDFKIIITEEAKKEMGTASLDLTNMQDIINDLPNYLQQNPKVFDELVKQTGLSKETILIHMTEGNGPTIELGLYSMGAHSPSSDRIVFDYTIIKNYNDNLSESSSDIDKAAYNLAMAALILHEYTHTGDQLINGMITGDNTINTNQDGTTNLGKQNSTSAYNHRGEDIEYQMLGTLISLEGEVIYDNNPNSSNYQQRISAGEGIQQTEEDIAKIKNKISLIKDEVRNFTQNGKPAKRKMKNVLPKDQLN